MALWSGRRSTGRSADGPADADALLAIACLFAWNDDVEFTGCFEAELSGTSARRAVTEDDDISRLTGGCGNADRAARRQLLHGRLAFDAPQSKQMTAQRDFE